jgi:Na+/phosphate symporter
MISKEVLQKLRAFEKIIDYVIEEKLEKESDYVELVLSVGMDKMLEDLIPKDEQGLLQKTMVAMFNENAEFVVNFVVNTLKRGEQIQKEEEIYKKHVPER